ncbi:MAG: L,D-transpeptidase catalytic domain [Solirubrobacteraceae bacterium]|nr:L,D-transpeptidase catalytic domain [Solirubrobacteraceae bacterium]
MLAVVAVLATAGAAGARTVVMIPNLAELHASPGGPLLLGGGHVLTEIGTAWVVRRQGGWLGIPTLQRRGGVLAWIRATRDRRLASTRLLVRVDLSERRVRVTHGARDLMSASVAIGAPRSPTPLASTSVSARIAVTPSSGYSTRGFGPMIVALRLWQPLASPGLPQGGIVAFHGGDDQRVGAASTGGCIGMRNADVRRLARYVRAGTPVIIRP